MKRTTETENKYQRFLEKKEILGFEYDKPVMNFKYWVVIKNKFPYDALMKKHHLIIPKERKASFMDLPKLARAEYREIISKLKDYKFYESVIENFPAKRSVPHHWHAHLVVWYKEYQD